MLADFFINVLDTFNIFYLWALFAQKNKEIPKLISSVFIASILVTIIETLKIHFIVEYLMFISVIRVIYKINLKKLF